MKKILALTLVFVLLAGLVACGGKTVQTGAEQIDPASIPEEARYGGVLDLVWEACQDTFDPHYTTGWASYIWSLQVYEMPITRDSQGNFCPGVCDFELSEDMLTLTLRPREGVTFHNGTAVEAADVAASMERSGNMVSNVKKWFTDFLADTQITDDAVIYTFKEYSPNTLYYISCLQNWCSILPAEICEKYPESPINVLEDCIGTGPYKLTDYQTNARFTMDRYDGYVPVAEGHDGLAAPKKAYMDRINVHINQDNTSACMGVLNGDYDTYALSQEFTTMAEQYGYVSYPDAVQNVISLAFNTKNPDRPIADVNLRKAIAAAVDFLQVADAERVTPCTPDCSVMNGLYYSDKFNQADYVGESNMELAKEYLAKSNYNGEELVIIASQDGGSIVLEDYMKKLGLNVRIDYMESLTLKEYRDDNSNPYDIQVFGFEKRDYVPSLISSAARDAYWGNEKKDELFAKIATLPVGSEESLATWDELVDLWVDDCSMVIIATSVNNWVKHPDLCINSEGTQRYFYNAFWTNPAAHMD